MRLSQRLERLEARVGARRPCPECAGRGRVRWVLDPPEGGPVRVGCPSCGRGLTLVVRPHAGPGPAGEAGAGG